MVYYIIACHKEQNGTMIDEKAVEQMVQTQVLGSGRQVLGECYALTNSVSIFCNSSWLCPLNIDWQNVIQSGVSWRAYAADGLFCEIRCCYWLIVQEKRKALFWLGERAGEERKPRDRDSGAERLSELGGWGIHKVIQVGSSEVPDGQITQSFGF